ncbi:MAG: Dabb family protein [Spirochaetia bacterium]|nr:Dabb family protein [Spirochaetia bacterium]
MIRHTVVFTLKHDSGSSLEKSFLDAAGELAHIPHVEKFECLRQVSKKNTYSFGLSMEFSSTENYQSYNTHPDHITFVKTRWIPEVLEFMEIDFKPFIP